MLMASSRPPKMSAQKPSPPEAFVESKKLTSFETSEARKEELESENLSLKLRRIGLHCD